MYCVVGSDNLSFYFIGLLIKRNHNKSDTERKSPMDLEFDAMIDFFFSWEKVSLFFLNIW